MGVYLKKKIFNLSSTHIILLSFIITILLGAFLLWLPISSKSGVSVDFIDALFTSTTSTCVTGLVTLPTFSTWSSFGQGVIFVLIQIGGLGVVTVLAGLTIFLHRKIGLGERLLIQDAFNLNTLSGLVKFVRKVIIGTFLIEGIGALLYMTVFIPDFGVQGIWIAIFNSVSAFCNAGIDIFAVDSLASYKFNPIINIVTMLLIVLGGLGYIVWWDILRVIKERRESKIRLFKSLTLHSKIVLTSTFIFLFVGVLAFFIFEYNNPLTMKEYNLGERIITSLFQSVTTRTAGFFTIPQENLTRASAIFSLMLMFIGGSPVGTAGGIKTVTFAVLFASALSAVRGKNEVGLFKRAISKEAISKALAVTFMSFSVFFVSTVLLSTVCDASTLDILYETASATATVGLSRYLTSRLDLAGKIIIIITMYLGRVGPISLAFAFRINRESKNKIRSPKEEISVG